MFLFSVWDTHFTLGGWVVGYFVDSYSCFLFACQVAFGIILPYVRIWATLCSLLCDICLLNPCTVALAWLFFMLFWFTCMLGFDLGNFVLWAYSQMSLPWTVSVDTPFLSLHTLSLFYISLQALSLKNHDYSYLRKFQSFGIVLGMGAQLSVVAHSKCGCAHTCYWFLELLICIPRCGKKSKRKEIKRVWIWALCVGTEVGNVGVWDYFHAWLRLIPHWSSISFVA